MLLGRHFACYPYAGVIDSRHTPPPYEPMSFYPTKDGHIFMICPEEDQYERLLELMGSPEWSRHPDMAGRKGRERNAAQIKAHISAWTSQWETEALFHACQQVRVGAAPVYDYPGLERAPHLQAREFFTDQEHPALGAIKVPGAPFHLKHPVWRPPAPAPRLGGANAALNGPAGPWTAPQRRAVPAATGADGADGANGAGPLAGVRILDLSWVWAGPQCTWMLASLGAEVIKVENSRRIDLTRRTHTFAREMEPNPNRNGFFNQINQGKESIAVNLGHPEGKALVRRLARECDVVISNFGYGVLERLGMDAETLQKENPALNVVMISSCGQTGPARAYLGYGPLISPLAGVSAQTGFGDGEPQDVGIAYGDPNAAVYAAIAITGTLLGRDGRGDLPGQVVDISMWEAMLCTAFEGWMNHVLGNPPHTAAGNRNPYLAPHNVYRCQGDDRWVAVSAENEAQWRALCGVIGRPELADDPRFADLAARKANEDALDTLIADYCAGRERWDVTRAMQAAGVPAMPSLNAKDLVEDAHMLAREAFTHAPHAEVGPRPLSGMPWRMLLDTHHNGRPAPCLGADTDTVLERLLGVNQQDRETLRNQGAIE